MSRGDNIRGRHRLEENQSRSGISGINIFLVLLLFSSIGFSIYSYQAKLVNDEQIENKIKTINNSFNNEIKQKDSLLLSQKISISDLEEELTIIKTLFDETINEINIKINEINILKAQIIKITSIPPNTVGTDPALQIKYDELLREHGLSLSKINALEKLTASKDKKISELEVQVALLIDQANPEPSSPKPPPECEITAAKVLKRPSPIYPKKALQRDIEGTVQLELDVSTSGKVKNVRTISSPSSILTSAATKAAYKIKFKPSEDCNGNLLMANGLRVSYSFKME